MGHQWKTFRSALKRNPNWCDVHRHSHTGYDQTLPFPLNIRFIMLILFRFAFSVELRRLQCVSSVHGVNTVSPLWWKRIVNKNVCELLLVVSGEPRMQLEATWYGRVNSRKTVICYFFILECCSRRIYGKTMLFLQNVTCTHNSHMSESNIIVVEMHTSKRTIFVSWCALIQWQLDSINNDDWSWCRQYIQLSDIDHVQTHSVALSSWVLLLLVLVLLLLVDNCSRSREPKKRQWTIFSWKTESNSK